MNVGEGLGKRLIALSTSAVKDINTIDLGVILKSNYDTMKFDVKLKTKIQGDVITLYSIPLVNPGFGRSAIYAVPSQGDIVVVIFSKHNSEAQLEDGQKSVDLGQTSIYDLNYAYIIGTILPIYDLDKTRYSFDTGGERKNRDEIDPFKCTKCARKYLAERIQPKSGDIIIYQRSDHEVRISDEEIYVKHKTGATFKITESGSIDMYAPGSIVIRSNTSVSLQAPAVGICSGASGGEMPLPIENADDEEDSELDYEKGTKCNDCTHIAHEKLVE